MYKFVIILITVLALFKNANAENFQIEKNCSGNGWNMKVVSVEVNKSETVVNLKSRYTENNLMNRGQISPPGSQVSFKIISTVNSSQILEIVDIKGMQFGVINPHAKSASEIDYMMESPQYTGKPGGFLDTEYKNETKRAKELEPIIFVGLVFPPIPKSWKSFHLRELPADKSDWICPNIQLPR